MHGWVQTTVLWAQNGNNGRVGNTSSRIHRRLLTFVSLAPRPLHPLVADYKADSETSKGLAAALKAGAAELSVSHAIDAAWGLSVLGGDKDAVAALLGVGAAAVQKDPASVDVYAVGAMYNAAVITGAKLPEQVCAQHTSSWEGWC